MPKQDAAGMLAADIERLSAAGGALDAALALHDYRTGVDFAHNGDRWFHAASTIKVPVLVGVFAAIDEGELSVELSSRVHVRNCFVSVADGRAYRIEPGRDAGGEVQARIGMTMRVRDLARAMIVTSSNLATNLLIDLVGIERLRRTLSRLGTEGIELLRGVEDERAYEQGISNRVTASGLVRVLRVIEEVEGISAAASREMLEILHGQEFRTGIPAGVPEGTRVAHKTGEISTVAHDAGLVYPADRAPYAIAILTRWDSEVTAGRRETIAALSRAAYEYLIRSANGD